MNILIYIPDIDGQSWGGVRQYAVGLLKILAQDDTNTYFVYHNMADAEILSVIDTRSNLLLVTDNSVLYKPYTYPGVGRRGVDFLLKRFKRSPLKRKKYLSHIELICAKFNIQIIHCPYQFIPQIGDVKLITTLHDVQELHFPEFFTPHDRALRATRFLDYVERADKVVVSYNHVKADLIKYFSLPSERIKVILLDMGKLWFDKFDNSDIINTENYIESKKYIFYPANTWKHKNHVRLIEAVAHLKQKYHLSVNIICSGHKNNYYYSDIEPKIKELSVDDEVRFIGIVDEKELFSIYKQALGVVIPTLYEAGSFPLMESILLGIPAICSNVTSLPETINNDVCIFDPFDSSDIADKIKLLWESQEFRDEALKNNLSAAIRLKNTDALEKIQNLYTTI